MNRKVLVGAVVALIAPVVHADVVSRVFWNPRISLPGYTDPFVGQSTDESLALAGDLTQEGLSRDAATSGIASIGFRGVTADFSESHYIEFSLIAAPDTALNVHDLLLQANTVPPLAYDHMAIRTSVDGFSQSFLGQAGPTNLQGNTGRPVRFDLESLPDLTSTTTFRLYVWGTSNGNFAIAGSIATLGYGMWFSNIDTYPVPAPGAACVLALGLLPRRRR